MLQVVIITFITFLISSFVYGLTLSEEQFELSNAGLREKLGESYTLIQKILLDIAAWSLVISSVAGFLLIIEVLINLSRKL